MENASKALLIAASVLIVILLIAFGMSIFKSTASTGAQASATGNQLAAQADQASQIANNTFNGLKSLIQ